MPRVGTPSPRGVLILLFAALLGAIGCGRGTDPGADTRPPGPVLEPKKGASSKDATAAAPTVRTTPALWAVVIGVDKYSSAGAVPAAGPGTQEGAAGISRWLREAGWDSEHVLLLLDQGSTKPEERIATGGQIAPTRSNIRWAFDTWLAERVKPGLGDVVLIYFAGQAVGLPPKDRDPGSPTREFLLPSDAEMDHLANTGWSIDADVDRLAEIDGVQVVCWLDTSLRGRREAVEAPQSLAEHYEPRAATLLDKLTRWPRVTTWLADDDHVAAEKSPFVPALREALGRSSQPNTLRQALSDLYRRDALRARGFQARGGFDPRLTLWNAKLTKLADPEPSLVLQRGHSDEVLDLLFLDESTVATAGRDSQVKFWRTEGSTLLRELPGTTHLAGVGALALGPDGRMLASGDATGQIRFWNFFEARRQGAEDGPDPRLRLRNDPSPHTQAIRGLAFLPDGGRILSWDTANSVALWDLTGDVPSLAEANWAEDIVALAVAKSAGPLAVATVDTGGKLWLFGPDLRSRPAPEPLHNAEFVDVCLAEDGRVLAVLDRQNHLGLWNAETGERVWEGEDADADIALLALDPGGLLAWRSGDTVRLAAANSAKDGTALPIRGTARKAAFSRVGDGRYLAVAVDRDDPDPAGPDGVSLWRIDEGGAPAAIDLGPARPRLRPLSLGFSPDGRTLAAGDQRGGIRLWGLDRAVHQALALAPLPFHRGKIANLSASADGRYLLTVTRDDHGELWDMEEGRVALTLDLRVTTGVVDASPGGGRLNLFVTTAREGDVVRLEIDPALGRVLTTETLRRPEGLLSVFGPMSSADGHQLLDVSPDGRWVAAGSTSGRRTCLWDREARSVRVITQDDLDGDTALAFSADSRRLACGNRAGVTTIWDLTAAEPRTERVHNLKGRRVEAVRFLPATVGWARLVTSHREGEDERGLVCFWGDKEAPLSGADDPLFGYIRTLAIDPGGKTLLLGGSDKAIWRRDLTAGPDGSMKMIDPRQRHAERVNAVVALPSGRVAVSGGDDASLRFWRLPDEPEGKSPALLGVLAPAVAAAAAPADEEPRPAGPSLFEDSWVAFTPDKIFDSSPGGDQQVTWLFERQVQRLEQLSKVFRQDRLLRSMMRGETPAPRRYAGPEAPLVSVDAPSTREYPQGERKVRLSVRLGEDRLRNIRLYQNGVPVRSWDEAENGSRLLGTDVVLMPGPNRFYAMATRPKGRDANAPDSIDGRSRDDVLLTYNGTIDPGRVHVLALGVSHYENRPLRYADSDAKSLSATIADLTAKGERQGTILTLTNEQVDPAAVESALGQIGDAVRFHPEDKVIIFLAGHTDVRDERFCLLLPSFPFLPLPEDQADRDRLLAQRGGYLCDAVAPAEEPKVTLPFVAIYRSLARFDALNRLIVIDACQAEMARLDAGIDLIRRVFHEDANGVRTSYLFAARRGEPASESSILQNGLLTYVVLRGLGRTPEVEPPAEVLSAIGDPPTADSDANGEVTTEELRHYVERTLPALAAGLDRLGDEAVLRGNEGSRRQSLKVRDEATRSFPLIRIGGQ